jgi:hypothetical protein
MDQVLTRVSQPSGTSIVGTVVGEQALDGLGGLTVKGALAIMGGQAGELGCDLGRGADEGPIGVDDDHVRAERIQRPGSPACAGQGRGQAKWLVDGTKGRDRDAHVQKGDRPATLVPDLSRRVADDHDVSLPPSLHHFTLLGSPGLTLLATAADP